MIKVSLKLDVSMSKIVFGFAGLSVAVCFFHYFSKNKNKQVGLESEKVVICDVERKKKCC